MHELQRRGVAVPGQVSVAGFDDIAEAAGVSPGLTTVRQPLDRMGREALRAALGLLRGAPVGERRFPGEVVLRASCGCRGGPPGAVADERGSGAAPLDAAAVAAALERAFPDWAARTGRPGWAEALAAGLAADAADAAGGGLAPGAAALLDGADVGTFEGWTAAVRTAAALARHGREAAGASRVAAAAEEALARLAAAVARDETARRGKLEEESRILRRLLLPIQLGPDAFRRALQEDLPRLGIRSLFLCRLEGEDGDTVLDLSYDPDGAAALDAAPGPFPARRLLPGQLAPGRRHAMAVLALHSYSRLLGFALCHIGPMQAMLYELLLHQLATVLKVNALMGEVRLHQAQLVESARHAGMAEVAAGVLHNVGNVLNSVKVAAEAIDAATASAPLDGLGRAVALLAEHQGELPRFFAEDPRAALLPEYTQRVTAALLEGRARIQRDAREVVEKTAVIHDTIRNLQQLTHEGVGQALRERVEPGRLLDIALELQGPLLAREKVRVLRDLAPVPPIVTQRAKVVHVLVALVKNAVDAMRGLPEDERTLTVGVAAEGDGVRLRVSDSGHGIAPEHLPRIFCFGFTTRQDGHGFGLHTCANHASELGGRLSAESDGPGRGATFTLLLPAEPPAEGRPPPARS
jgi:signal transduction histidine kinase